MTNRQGPGAAVLGDPASTTSDDERDPATAGADAKTLPDNDIEAAGDDEQPDAADASTPPPRRSKLVRAFSFGVVPFAALAVALGAAYLKYEDSTTRAADSAGVESVQAAKESTIAMLSYTPDTAQASLTAARDRLTGTFRDSYTSLTDDVVIPGAREKKISATATVAAAASVSASADHAVVVVFVNQAVIMGNDAPTQTASVVQVTLDKVGNRWLIAGFDPK
ncbi:MULTISPECIES: hypothetical protein [unclassified Mycobacterium]|uniref:hypothetical protein n=1 Tax=unclassified Mycobacterium TaxID=2642494 RepID=UPI0029C6DF1A|nr:MULTISPECIES: hypothetical protein [unclassified Mycobacterium]